MEEAHDTVADVGDGVLSEDELYRRFLEEELQQQGSRPPVSVSVCRHHQLHTMSIHPNNHMTMP